MLKHMSHSLLKEEFSPKVRMGPFYMSQNRYGSGKTNSAFPTVEKNRSLRARKVGQNNSGSYKRK
jgi:hypothetical protein